MPAANTRECFSEFMGQKVVGVLFDALPWSRKDIARGTKTLVFEDGRGLTISSKGTYWIESADDVARAIRRRQDDLAQTERELLGTLALAGVQGAPNNQEGRND